MSEIRIDKTWYEAKSDTYTISTAEQLAGLADLVNSGEDNFSGKTVNIGADITVGTGWKGIGVAKITMAETNSPYVKSGTGFAGTLDGTKSEDENWTITVNRNETDVNGVGGLINYLAPAGVVQNLNVDGTVNIVYSERPEWDYTVDGLSVVGGVVGYNCGTIDKVTSNVTITTEDADDTTGLPCQVYDVGGIAGFNDNLYMEGAVGVIRNCTNNGNVTGYEKVGGIVGENAGLIASCSNTGGITTTSTRRGGTGGITGRNGNNNTAIETGSIWCCYNTGDINSADPDPEKWGSWIGGIAGYQNSLSTASNGYDTGNLEGWGYTGYIVGCSNNPKIEEGVTDHGVTRFYYLNGETTGAVKGSPKTEEGHPNSDAELTINGNGENTDFMYGPKLLGELKPSDDKYGKWKGVDNALPNLAWDATAKPDASKGWKYEETNIYLNPASGSDDKDGLSAGTAVKTLDEALSKSTIGNIYVMDTVTINKGVTLDKSIKFIRYNPSEFTGPMFIIDAENDPDYGVTYVTFEGITVDGGGKGTLFEVKQGRLRLRGNSVLENAEMGVLIKAKESEDVIQAQAELNEVWIKKDTATAVEIAGKTVNTGLSDDGTDTDTNNLILNTFGIYEIRLRGVVKLAAGAYITVEAAQSLSGRMKIECADASPGRKIAVGAGYTLTAADAEDVTYGNDDTYCTALDGNEMVLAPFVYLSSEEDETKENHYRNLSDALDNTKVGGVILVTGTTVVKAGNYDKEVRIRRAADMYESDMMFDVSGEGTVTMSGLNINGGGRGTIAEVSAEASLELKGGVKLADCGIAVAVASYAQLRVLDTVISASKYSIKVANDEANFFLSPAQGTRISGTVYLGTDAIISVESTLTTLIGKITIECSAPSNNLKVASADGTGFSSFTEADASKIVYLGAAYNITIRSSNTLVLSRKREL